MLESVRRLFDSSEYMPHGHCFLWEPAILWTHIISDTAIAASYYSIPLALIYFARKRMDLPFKKLFWLFGAFILLCGTTHIMGIWTLWNPDYALDAVIKAMTAIVSVTTFIVTVKLLPKALAVPGPKQLAALNHELHLTIFEKDVTQQALKNSYDMMERQVEERTAELRASNESLQSEIAERKRTEEQMSKLLDELTHSNTELQRFAYICSHDLQEPARMVSSYATMFSRRFKDQIDEDANKYLHFLVDGAERMQSMIKSILSYSRLENKERQYSEVDCNKLVQDVLHDLQGSIEESGAEIACEPLARVWGDAIQLSLVFQNLIGNALKFHEGNSVPRIRISSHLKGNDWLFAVRDNGIGISDQHLQKVFHIFQRLNRREDYPGTGIGLAICKKVVERHGGQIWVESVAGQGSTFFFTIPSSREQQRGDAE